MDYVSSMLLFKKEGNMEHWDGVINMNSMNLILESVPNRSECSWMKCKKVILFHSLL